MDIKFVLVGGGSYGWTYKLITDICCIPFLKGMHVVLYDIDPETLHLVVPLCEKISSMAGADIRIEGSTNLESSLKGADFVGLTISTAGDEGTELDHSIPERYGILQTVGDTVGPGGWSRGLRNIPVVVDIVRKVEHICPNAWFMNYSNPMTVLTRTLQRVSKVKSMGICHELQGLLLHMAYFLGVDWQKDIQVRMAGINHLIWILEADVCGRDGLELFKEYFKDPEKFKPIKRRKIPEELIESGGVYLHHEIKLDLLKRTGSLPAAGDAHTAEFFSHYIKEGVEKWGPSVSREAHTFAHVRDRDKRKQKVQALLNGKEKIWLKRSHEHASKIIAALSGGLKNLLTPLNLANTGQISNLPQESVVETLAIVNKEDIQPVAVGELSQILTLYIMRHIPIQEMIVEAGLKGDKDLAVLALSCDPLIPSPDIAKKIADDVFNEFKDWLPQFNGKWSY